MSEKISLDSSDKHTIFTKIFGIRKESSKGPAPKGD